MLIRFLLFMACVCAIKILPAQPAARNGLSEYLVNRIAHLQVKEDAFYLPGIYPSYVHNKQKFSTRKKDLTIFYNALIDKTLQEIFVKTTPHNQEKINTLLHISRKLYPRFKNSKGRNTYNFWLRDSAYTFPYSWWIPIIKKDPNVPDDMDDTSLSHMALGSHRDSAAAVHRLFQAYINDTLQPLKTIGKPYRVHGAYSTWFGKNFPVVFDVSVMANTLYFIQTNALEWTSADSASMQVITQALDTRDYFKKARLVSPYYGKPSIIMYHISRLMQVKYLPELEERKGAMIADTKAMYLTCRSVMEKIILSATLKRWGIETGYYKELEQQWALDPAFIIKEVEQSNEPFFIGNIPSYFPYGLKKIFTRLDALFYYHFCPAYNDVLLLEYITM